MKIYKWRIGLTEAVGAGEQQVNRLWREHFGQTKKNIKSSAVACSAEVNPDRVAENPTELGPFHEI